MAAVTRKTRVLGPAVVELDPIQHPDGNWTQGELCERCQRFDLQSFAGATSGSRGYRISDVKDAAANGRGCPFCALLLDSVREVRKPRDTSEMELNLLRLPVDNDPAMYVHMTVSEDGADPAPQPSSHRLRANRLHTAVADRFSEVRNASDHELCLAAEPDSAAAQNCNVSGRYLGNNPNSDAHFSTVRDWIDNCTTQHPKCKQTVSGTAIDAHRCELPARCVRLRTRGSGLHAALARTEGARGSYMTLTHRWNDETERSRTTTANYAERLQEIDLRELPQLFRDVFAIAVKLKVRYVWIDSLCILQAGDGGADWRREAPRMAQYYQHSLFTIAGTMPDMQNGLLHPYPDDSQPWASDLVRMPYRDGTGAPAGHFFVYRRKATLANDYWATVRESILFRRGWILQEWLLSKRLLWYTPRGLFFECHTDGPRTEYQEKLLLPKTPPSLRPQLQMKPLFHLDNPTVLDFWYRAIELYSSCHLTKPDQDRILAVAGLAKEVGLIMAKQKPGAAASSQQVPQANEVYLAGLWLCDIHHASLWEEEGTAQSWDTPVPVANAPSWSWASLMTPVRWPGRDEEAEQALQIIGFCQKTSGQGQDNDSNNHHATPHNPQRTTERGGRPTNSTATAPFDPTNLSACLHVRGTLLTLHLRGFLTTEKNLKAAAAATAYHIPGTPTAISRWRALCSPERPEMVVGWASAERLRPDGGGDDGGADSGGDDDHNGMECADGGVAVCALHVSTRYVRSGLWLKHKDPVLDVILVEAAGGGGGDGRSGGGVYRRLGVGRIFDESVIAEFDGAESTAVQLV